MPTFKDYTMDQLQLPLSFEDFIPENHLVRVVNTVVECLDLKPLYDRYKEGGCPAYHPKMMLKVMIYSFSQKTYSSSPDSEISSGKHQLYVDRRRKQTRLSDDKPLSPGYEGCYKKMCSMKSVKLLIEKKLHKVAELLFGWYENRSQCQ